VTGAVSVSGVGKAYRSYLRPRHRLLEWLTGGKWSRHEVFWALRELHFTVPPGQAVGIVGLNGAGKTTLLKILTGTTEPTEGAVLLDGRTAALLELGLGFHPDFTGRQNAMMAGQLMGLSTEQVVSLMSDIEEFAEIGPYIDQHVRTYSTGMAVRLAFAVATAARPDIFIVDETLAVGDTYFQHKCIRRIREFKAAGTTILLVSHDAATMRTLCDRCLLIERGRLVDDGPPDRVLDYYNALIAKREATTQILQAENRTGARSGTFEAKLIEIDLLDREGRPVRGFTVGERARVCCRVHFATRLRSPTVGVLIRDRLGNDVFGTNTYHAAPIDEAFEAGDELEVEFEIDLNLGVGTYTLTVAVHSHTTHLVDNYDWWDKVIAFEMLPGPPPLFIGTAWLPVRVHVRSRRGSERGEEQRVDDAASDMR
jgi:homopolymeric O-antigen transport system ATP-binding protein